MGGYILNSFYVSLIALLIELAWNIHPNSGVISCQPNLSQQLLEQGYVCFHVCVSTNLPVSRY